MELQLDLVLKAFVAANRSLVRLLISRGATFPVVAERLRHLFVNEAVAEIRARGKRPTASAVSLLSGMNRKDLRAREFGTSRDAAVDGKSHSAPAPPSLIDRVVGRWMSEPPFHDGKSPRALQRGDAPDDFDALVQGVSTDVGPRAVLDEMLRLGVVRMHDERIELDTMDMVPCGDFAAMAEALGQNLADHATAACANLTERRSLLEQAVHVDEISPESAHLLHQEAIRASQAAMSRVLRRAKKLSARDATKESRERRQTRVRFGVYFYAGDAHDKKETE